MKLSKFLMIAMTSAFFFYSCSDDDDSGNIITVDEEILPFDEGFLVTNQGQFNGGIGTVSYLDAGLTTATNDIFQTVNGDNLGTIVQSIGFVDTNAYIISNVSNRLTVVDRFTFEEIARIETGLENPRYFVEVNGKGYVSNWGDPFVTTDDYIAIIDLENNIVTGMIGVGEGPEEMLTDGNQIYVANQGGFGVNNIVTVIDPSSDSVVTTIPVGDVPNSLQIDASGNLWVLAGGSPLFTGTETGGVLTQINTSSNAVIENFNFEQTEHPNYLSIFGSDLYYYLASDDLGSGEVFKSSVSNFEMPITSEISGLDFFNMFIVAENTLLGCNVPDFSSPGTIDVYNLQDNTLTNSLEVGIIPGDVYINE